MNVCNFKFAGPVGEGFICISAAYAFFKGDFFVMSLLRLFLI